MLPLSKVILTLWGQPGRVVSGAYDKRRDALLEEVKKPAHTYYGDQLEVVVSREHPRERVFS